MQGTGIETFMRALIVGILIGIYTDSFCAGFSAYLALDLISDRIIELK